MRKIDIDVEVTWPQWAIIKLLTLLMYVIAPFVVLYSLYLNWRARRRQSAPDSSDA
jgi:heme/copper-type cytochrome/quinol oxidase subunit 2